MATSSNYSFEKLDATDIAGHTSINSLIDSIDSTFNTRLPFLNTASYAALGSGDAGKVMRWSGAVFALAKIDADSLATSAVTTDKINTGAVTADKLASTLDLSSKTVSVAAPNANAHAATKQYVDSTVSGGNAAWATNSTITAAGITSNTTVTATNGFTGNVTGNISGSASAQSASNINTGTLPSARLSGNYTVNITGNVTGNTSGTSGSTALLRATQNTGNMYLTANANALIATSLSANGVASTGNIASNVTGNLFGNATSATEANQVTKTVGNVTSTISWDGYDWLFGGGSDPISCGAINSYGIAATGINANQQIYTSSNIWASGTIRSSVVGNTSANTGAVYYTANGVLGNNTSLREYKKNIATHNVSKTDFMALKPSNYDWKKEKFPDEDPDSYTMNHTRTGFIVEDILEAGMPQYIRHTFDGEPRSIDWDAVTTMLVKVCQDQQVEIDNLKARIEALEA